MFVELFIVGEKARLIREDCNLEGKNDRWLDVLAPNMDLLDFIGLIKKCAEQRNWLAHCINRAQGLYRAHWFFEANKHMDATCLVAFAAFRVRNC